MAENVNIPEGLQGIKLDVKKPTVEKTNEVKTEINPIVEPKIEPKVEVETEPKVESKVTEKPNDKTEEVDNGLIPKEEGNTNPPVDNKYADYSDVEYQLTHDLQQLGLELDDNEISIFGDILKSNFDKPEIHAKYVDKLSNILKDRAEKDRIATYPKDVRDYINYRNKGGNPEEFFKVKSNNYNKVELKADDVDQHLAIMTESYQKINNMSYEEALAYAKLQSKEGNTFIKAKAAKDKLVALQNQQEKEVLAKTELEYNNNLQIYYRKQEELISKINTGVVKVGDKQFTIPEKDRKTLEAAIKTPYNNNGSYYYKNLSKVKDISHVKDVSELATYADVIKAGHGMDGEILATYMLMFGGFDKLISNQATTEYMNRLRKREATSDVQSKEDKVSIAKQKAINKPRSLDFSIRPSIKYEQ